MKQFLKKAIHQTYAVGDRVGVHLLPKHYYSPVADRTWLQHNKELWVAPSSMTGVHWDLDEQLGWLSTICAPYYREVEGSPIPSQCAEAGLGYGLIEAQVLHCFLRSSPPSKIVEIGGGVTTCLMLEAVSRNEAEGKPHSAITTIEPFPSSFLAECVDVELIREPCQAAHHDYFTNLKSGDLLFVDSSHTVKIGSDVVRICTELLPSLSPGVIVHIHDIFFPYLYPRDSLQKFFGWQETAMVLALLIDNPNFEILACLSALSYDRPAQLASVVRDFQPQRSDHGLPISADNLGYFPSSLWIKRVASES